MVGLMSNENRALKRKGKYSIGEVFEYIDASPRGGARISFHGDSIHMRGPRMLNFRLHGIVCVSCGMRGAFFAKEQFGDDDPHLNLYGFNKQGSEILMTRDHIRPKAKSGTNHLFNLQPMCFTCNNGKADVWTTKDKLRYAISKIKHWFIPSW